MSGLCPSPTPSQDTTALGALAFVVVVEPQAHDVSERPKTNRQGPGGAVSVVSSHLVVRESCGIYTRG